MRHRIMTWLVRYNASRILGSDDAMGNYLGWLEANAWPDGEDQALTSLLPPEEAP